MVSCEKYDLERTNPLDEKNPNYKYEPVIALEHYKLNAEKWYDSRIFPGAQISMIFAFRNLSIYDAEGIKISFEVNEDDINISSHVSVVGDIFANSVSVDKEYLTFSVNNNVKVNSTITISLKLSDGLGNMWDENIELEVLEK